MNSTKIQTNLINLTVINNTKYSYKERTLKLENFCKKQKFEKQ